MKKGLFRFAAFLLLAFMVLSISACDGSVTRNIYSLRINSWGDEIIIGIGQQEEDYVNVSAYNDFTADDILFISEDESVARVEYTKTGYNNVYFNIIGVGEGETNVYFSAEQGKVASDKIKVTVKQIVTEIEIKNPEPIEAYLNGESQFVEFDAENEEDNFFYASMFRFVSEDENVATVEYDDDYAWGQRFIVNPVGVGETVVYIETIDKAVRSQEVKVTVSDTEIFTTTAKETEPDNDSDSGYVADDDNNYSDNDNTDNNNYNSTIVYITPTGKKYHYSRSCAGDNAMERNLDDVINLYDPCKKCAN